jgi:anti-sigma factor (TIGR02949 family)
MTEPIQLTCDEALRLLAAFLDGELAGRDEHEVQQHLERCRSCFSRAEFEKHLKQRLRELGRESVQPGFEGRIRALIAKFEGPAD